MGEEVSIFDEIGDSQLFLDDNSSTETKSDDNKSDTNNDSSLKKTDDVSNDSDNTDDDNTDVDDNTSQDNDLEDTDGASSSDKDNDSSSPTLYKAFAKLLVEEGVPLEFNDDEEITTAQQLTEKIVLTMKAEVEDWKNGLPDVIKDLINNYEENVPLDRLIGSKSRQIELKNITRDSIDEDVELQKNISKRFLMNKGFTEDEANDEVKEYENYGTLADKAKKQFSGLQKIEEENEKKLIAEAKLNQIELEKNHKAQLLQVQQDINKLDNSYIPNIEFNQALKDKIYKNMTTIVEVDPKHGSMNSLMVKAKNDRFGYEKAIHALDALGVFDVDENGKIKPNFKKIISGVKTSATKDLEKVLASTSMKKERSNYNSNNGSTFLDDIKDPRKIKIQ